MREILKKKRAQDSIMSPTMWTIVSAIAAILVIGFLWNSGLIQKLNLFMPNFDDNNKASIKITSSVDLGERPINLVKEDSKWVIKDFSPFLVPMSQERLGEGIQACTSITLLYNGSDIALICPVGAVAYYDEKPIRNYIGFIHEDGTISFAGKIKSFWEVSSLLTLDESKGTWVTYETKKVDRDGYPTHYEYAFYPSSLSTDYNTLRELILS